GDPPGRLPRGRRLPAGHDYRRRLFRQDRELNTMYTYEVTASDMFTDRSHQFEKFGIPLDDINRVAEATTDMWANAPGGWVYEWSRLAEEYVERGEHYLASMVYGCAKFPCLTDDARARALRNQL